MNNWEKFLVAAGFITVISGFSFVIFKMNENLKMQKDIETEVVKQKELIDNITRSQSQYATKDTLEKFIKDSGVNLKAIQEDLKKLDGKVTGATTVYVYSKGETKIDQPSDSTGPKNPNPVDPKIPDPYGYLAAQQNYPLLETFENTNVPIGTVGFSAWKEKPWSDKVYAREYKVTNVIGTDENERIYVYNKFSIKVNDKNYDVKIGKAETLQEYPKAQFYFWNPRLYLGADSGLNVSKLSFETSVNGSLSFMSYGRYKTTPDFAVAAVGLGYSISNNNLNLFISPFYYNLGKHIPLIHNLYVGPSVSVGPNGSFSLMGGLKLAL